MSMEIETTYAVQYQKRDDPNWYEFTGPAFTNPTGANTSETADFDEAFHTARDLYDGRILTDDRPRYRAYVTAVHIVQRISAGGVVITFGIPQVAVKEDTDA